MLLYGILTAWVLIGVAWLFSRLVDNFFDALQLRMLLKNGFKWSAARVVVYICMLIAILPGVAVGYTSAIIYFAVRAVFEDLKDVAGGRV